MKRKGVIMSIEFIFRIIGMIVLGIAGGYLGAELSPYNPMETIRVILISALTGALAGIVLTPYFTTRPARALRSLLGRVAAETLFSGLMGMVVGLLIAALLSFPLSLLPEPFGRILPFIGVLLFGYFGVMLFVMRQGDIMSLFGSLRGSSGEGGSGYSGTNLNRTI
jgi:uncharacterized protein YacL